MRTYTMPAWTVIVLSIILGLVAVAGDALVDFANSEYQSFQVSLFRPSGFEALLRLLLFLLFVSFGLAVSRLLAARRYTEDALKESEEKFSRIFRSIPDAVALSTLDGRLVEVNECLLRLSGYARDEMLGKTTVELGFWPDVARRRAFMEMLQKNGRVVDMDIESRQKSGSVINVLLSADIVEMHGDRYILVVVRDVTDRKQSEDALRQSEERFRTLVENLPMGISITSADGRYLMVNTAFLTMRGYGSVGELMQEPISRRYYDPNDRERWIAALRKDGRVEGFEVRLKRKDGSVFWASATSLPQTANSGEQRFISMTWDITARKQAEEMLRQSEEKLRLMFESVAEGIVVVDLAGIIMDVNQEMLDMHRVPSKDEMVGKPLAGFVSSVDRNRVQRGMQRTVEDMEMVKIERGAVRWDGSAFTVEVSARALKDVSGQTIGSVAAIRDVSERKRAEEKLRESEEKFSALFHSVPDGVALSTLNGRLVEVNESLLRMTGYARSEMVGRTTVELGLWADAAHRERFMRALQENGRVVNLEADYCPKTGTEINALLSADIIELRGTKYILTVIRDVTDRNRAVEALRAAEENYRNSLDQSPLGISILTDSGGELLYANKALLDIYGFSSIEELKAVPFKDRLTPESHTDHLKRIESRQQGLPVATSFDMDIVRRDGEIRNASVSMKPVTWNGATRYQVIYQDVTDVKKLQEQLMAQDRLASIGQLVSGIAHELNNPLTSVIGFSDILLEKGPGDDARTELKIINDEASRAATIVRNLLTFARRSPGHKQPVDINELIQRVLELRAYEEKVSNIQVRTRLLPELPGVMGNGSQLQQVFMNIVINAEFFMIEAHNGGNLNIATQQKGDVVRASFRDDGPGIAKEHMRSLFNPFFTTKDVGEGTGLGLSICQGIVREHGGRMWAESEPGKGATFFVDLPVYREPAD